MTPTMTRSKPRRPSALLACAIFGAACLGLTSTAIAEPASDSRASPEERREMMRDWAAHKFERMDRNSDGVVTWDEYWASMKERHERRAERRQARGERRQARGERRQARGERGQARGDRREARAERRQARRDRGEARGDRRKGQRGWRAYRDLSPEERREMKRSRSERRFERMDLDGDGAITWDEYSAWIERRMERRGARKGARGHHRKHGGKRGG